MKTSVAVLILSVSYLSVADVQQLDHGGGETNNTEINDIKPACLSACDITGTLKKYFQFADILRKVEDKLKNTEKQLEDLRREVKGQRVAFGAVIGDIGNIGPFNTEIILIYKKVYSRTSAYNPTTGIFTAPARGIYYFSFSGHNHSTRPMGLRLMKNGVQVVTVYNHPAGNRYETATNGINLQLEVGDQVYMTLGANTWIYDNINSHSTFSGHLLFTL